MVHYCLFEDPLLLLEGGSSGGGAKFAGRGLPIVGIAIPYGVYDLCANRGFVVVGTSHDTPDFAADNLLRWWQSEGLERYGAGQDYTCRRILWNKEFVKL